MSKNFELMQQVGLESPSQISSSAAPKTSFSPVPTNGHGDRDGTKLNLDKLAQEETLKLVQRVFFAQSGVTPHVVLFAGIDSGNGCSRICVRAAEILAANSQGRVCIVDANLRSPSLPEFFGVTNHRGLTDALLQQGPIEGFAKQVRTNLWLLSCGSLASDSANLLNSELLKNRIAELRKEFDYVLIDAPPLGQYADAVALGRLADGLIFVLEANSTRREAARKVMDGLRAAQVNVLGAVLNKRTYPIPDSLYYRL
jgi:protein-tyrosine kinase